MRQWIDLVEHASQRLLYHGTSMTGLVYIASMDELGAYGGEDQASFSRNIEVSRRFGPGAIGNMGRNQLAGFSDMNDDFDWKTEQQSLAYRAEIVGGGKGAVLIVDWDKLNAVYPTEPLDTGDGDDAEEEEAVFQDIEGLSRFMAGIEIDRAGWDRFCAFVVEHGGDEDRQHIEQARAWVARFL